MAHHLAHGNDIYGEFRDVRYTYDELNRLTKVDDSKQNVFDEIFAYDAQGRITAQRRAGNVVNPTGGEYSYYSGKNRLKSVADNMGGTADERTMSDTANFVYDSVGNLTYDKYLQGEGSKNALVHFYCRTVVYCALRNSKGMEILYDWRGMPIEFIQTQQPTGSSSDTLFRLLMKYDGTGRRISKTVMHKVAGASDWDTAQVTHYTGIGTEIRENYAGPAKETKVVVKSLQGECRKNKLACSYDRAAAADAGGVNMPQGLGRYGIEDAENPDMGSGVGYIPNTKFEWYLKNHLGSTMLVYGTQADANPAHSDIGTTLAAYDYRAFGEMVELLPPPTGKVTENFTGKEHDDEIALDYFGARYLDPMLGMWISVDPARQFASPYLYAGNGYNPVNGVDPDGNVVLALTKQDQKLYAQFTKNLNPEQAERLSAIERDKNFVMVFMGVDHEIPVPDPYDPNRGKIAKGIVTPREDKNILLAVVCYTCEDAQGTFAHEVSGHGRQIFDFLNGGRITGPRTMKDVKPWIQKNEKELEKDAFEVQGTPKSDKDLEDMGY